MAEELPGPLGEWLADRIPKLAAQAHRRYPTVPRDDFEQQLWLRAIQRKDKLSSDLRQGHEGFMWKELRAAATRLGREDQRYRRAAKAQAEGYRTFDEEFYSTGVLVAILPALIDAEFDPATAVDAASKGTDAAGIFIKADDPGAFGNYQVMLIDVATACGKIRPGSKRLLAQYYGLASDENTEDGRWDRQKLASSMGITSDALRQRVHYALRELQDELGGEDPWRRQDRPTREAAA